jgi:phytoene dehydrogenase-like protein
MNVARGARAFDAVVIGGDIDGLVAAARLAGRGSKVLLINESEALGGAARELEFAPGYRAAPFAPVTSATLVALGDGEPLMLDLAGAPSESLERRSASDAARWPEFARRMQALAGFLGELYRASPPRIDADGFGEVLALANLGLKFRKLGRTGMAELLRTLPIPIADLLDDEFEAPALKGALAAQAVMDLAQGPTAAGTAFTFLHRQAVRLATARQELPARAYEQRALESGVMIERSRKVHGIAVRDGRATGIVLDAGEEIGCRTVISSLDPNRSLLELIDPRHLDPEFIHAVRNIRYRGVTTKILLALAALPATALPRGAANPLAGGLVIAPTIRAVERAYEATKYGRCSEEPFVEIRFPSVTQPDLAPAGRHVAILHVQYTPYRLREGAWSALRDSIADEAIARVDRHLPGFASLVLDRLVLTPPDIESRFGLREGAVSQGEMALDQILFMRPVPAAARYATPIEGLFLCGAGTHPGVGLQGISGELAARAAAVE